MCGINETQSAQVGAITQHHSDVNASTAPPTAPSPEWSNPPGIVVWGDRRLITRPAATCNETSHRGQKERENESHWTKRAEKQPGKKQLTLTCEIAAPTSKAGAVRITPLRDAAEQASVNAPGHHICAGKTERDEMTCCCDNGAHIAVALAYLGPFVRFPRLSC
jgi:hypothetical protein